ncbi:zinc-finger associated domain containing protein, partial [Oryctes borbonicus]
MAGSMVKLRLKSNILELVCRICLKMHKERYNIFELSESDRLPANMIIELMCMQVLKDDTFPKTICSNCLERLNDAYNLKLLATESSIKLYNFCRSKSIGNDLEDEKDINQTLEIKEEPEDVKIEENIAEELHLNTVGKEKDFLNKTDEFSGNSIDNGSCIIPMKTDRTVKKLDSTGQERKEMNALNG